MKFSQLLEYNIRNIFVEKPYTKYGEETLFRPRKPPDPFLKN